MIFPYVYNETKILDDEISASRAGNTGLTYKSNTDQLLVGVFNDANYRSIWLYDRETLTKDSEISLTVSGDPTVAAIQGVAYNSDTGNIYYVWNNRLYEIQEDGTDVQDFLLAGGNRASICYYDGWIYYHQTVANEVKRISTDGNTIETIFSLPIAQGEVEGLFIEDGVYYIGSSNANFDRGHSILKLNGSGDVLDTWDTIYNEKEGLAKIGNTFYQCKNRYYHDSINDGNAIWKFTI